MKALVFALLLCGTANAAPRDKIVWEADVSTQGQRYTWAKYGHCWLQFMEKGGVTRAHIEIIVDLGLSKEPFCLTAKGDTFRSAFVTKVDDMIVTFIAAEDPDIVDDPDFMAIARKTAKKLAKALKCPYAVAFTRQGSHHLETLARVQAQP